MRQELRDFVVVKVRSVFKDESSFQGHDMRAIIMDVTFNPQRHINTCGIVHSVPVENHRDPIYFKATGIPRSDKDKMVFRSSADIPMDIKVGSKVYFHYNVLVPDSHKEIYNHRYMGKEYEEDPVTGQMVEWLYFRVRYRSIFCMVEFEKTNKHSKDFTWYYEKHMNRMEVPLSVNDDDEEQNAKHEVRYEYQGSIYKKNITMIGSWTLVKPDEETWEDISEPVMEMEFGLPVIDPITQKVKFKPKSEWILKKMMPTNKYLFGTVQHVGKPLNGDILEVEPGLYVMYRPSTDTEVEIEGDTYHRMIQSNISAKFPIKKQTA